MPAVNSDLLINELTAFKATTTIGKLTVGANAKDIPVSNTPNDGSNALLMDDIIIYPSEEMFDKCYFVLEPTPTPGQTRAPQKTAGVMCIILRDATYDPATKKITGGTQIPLPVYAATYKRRVLLYFEELDENGQPKAKGRFTDDEACVWPNKGLDAKYADSDVVKEFAAIRDSMYKAFKQFAGKTQRVIGLHQPLTLGFSNELDEKGARKRILRTQKVLDIINIEVAEE